MMLAATPKNIGWLLAQLYAAKRALANEDVPDPVFVLITKTAPERLVVQEKFYRYFFEKYGLGEEPFKHIKTEANTDSVSSFHFPEIGCRVVLVDLELAPDPNG